MIPVFFFVLVEILLFEFNYTPGTYFLGWDNLFPEMNFWENFQRSFFGLWQEYRGLGLLDGMSFAANLVHYIFLFLLSFVMPQSLLRYFFLFFMHFLGGVGVYFLLKELIYPWGANMKPPLGWQRLAVFFGVFFYLFNIGTVQMFFVPYEVFTVHFAFLPILVLFLIKYLKKGTVKHLFYFMVLSLLSTPQAHVPTLFIVYLISLGAVLVFHLIFTGSHGLSKVAAVLAVTFAVNSFWGLPYIYSALNNAQTIASSKINQMATEEIYLKNKAYGNFTNVALMKGFSLDFIDNQVTGAGYMMQAWRNHTSQPLFIIIASVLFILLLVGIISAVIGREKRFYPFICMFLFAFLMLADDTPVIGGFAFILRSYIPYFDNIFRFTFTKFAILYAFSASVLIGWGIFVVMDRLQRSRVKLGSLAMTILKLLIFAGFIYYSFPAWQGNFFYRKQGLEVPKEYFMLVDFFNSQDKNTRVALIPQTSLWGWTHTSWGYQGSGFLWYGIPQSTLDGAFYPWSRNNENYYWELTQAFFQKNKLMFENILDKYQISWIVIDDSLKSPLSQQISYQDQIREVVEQSGKLKLEKDFGQIRVYKVNLRTELDKFVFLEQNLPEVGPVYNWEGWDQGYLDYGNYSSILNSEFKILNFYYPFRSLFTAREQKELEFQIEDKGEYLAFQSTIPKQVLGTKLVIPPLSQDEAVDPLILFDGEVVEFDTATRLPTEVTLPSFGKGVLEIRMPKAKTHIESLDPVTLNLTPKACNQFNQGIYKYGQAEEAGRRLLRMESLGSDNCLTFSMPNLPQRMGYLVAIESQYVEGKSLSFAVINQTSQRADLEVNLPKDKRIAVSYFIIPPMEYDGAGYTLYFNNVSFERVRTVNNLGKITTTTIPYQFLKSLRIVTGQPIKQQINTSVHIKTDHPNPVFYNVAVSGGRTEGLDKPMLVLSQSFDKGWKAYKASFQFSIFNFQLSNVLPFFFGKEIKDHVLVNNWANGWVLDNNCPAKGPLRQVEDEASEARQGRQLSRCQLIIVYLPQYLQYAGFGFMVVIFTWLFVRLLTNRRKYG